MGIVIPTEGQSHERSNQDRRIACFHQRLTFMGWKFIRGKESFMLKALKEQLKLLAEDQNKIFHKALKERVGKRATQEIEVEIKNFILLMPDWIEQVHTHWNRQNVGTIKKIGGYLLTYLYHPHDFLSEEKYGLLGYLDDAYYVACIYELVLKNLYSEGVTLKPFEEELMEKLPQWKSTIHKILPKEAHQIDAMIEGLLSPEENKELFESLFKYT